MKDKVANLSEEELKT